MKFVGFLIIVCLWMGTGEVRAQDRIALPAARIQLPTAMKKTVVDSEQVDAGGSESSSMPVQAAETKIDAVDVPPEQVVEATSMPREDAALPDVETDDPDEVQAVEAGAAVDDVELPPVVKTVDGSTRRESEALQPTEPAQPAQEEEVIDPVKQLVTNLVPTNQVEDVVEEKPFDPNEWLAPYREKEERRKTELLESVEEVTLALQADGRADLYLQRANLFVGLGEYLSAEKDFTIAAEKDEAVQAEVHIGLGRIAAAQGNTRGAVAEYGKAIRLSSDNPDAFYYRGKLYEIQDMSQRAIRDYERALALDPEHVPALVGIGVLQLERENFSVALRSLNRALVLNAEQGDALLSRGKLHLITGQHEAAFSDFSAALDFMQPSADLLFMRGKAAHALSNDELAVQDFTVAHTLDPTRADILISRSQSWQALGESAKARADRVRAYDAIYP